MSVLRAKELVDLAIEDTHLDDFGGDDFHENLQLLADEAATENLTPRGVMSFNSYSRRSLGNRLRLVEDRKRAPSIATQKITQPLFVVGLPRTGTTFLHSLLAQDPGSRSILQWESTRPSPPPLHETYKTDPRVALNIAESPHDPGFAQRHISGAELPVECSVGLGLAFCTGATYFLFHTASQLQRLQGEIPAAYKLHRRLLEHLQSHTQQTHWVLKSPEHFGHMSELIDQYPDARVVVTHRDPTKVIPSVSSLAAYMQEMNQPPFDHTRTGPEMLAYWDALKDKFMTFRRGAGKNVKILDLSYREITDAPMTVVQKIYDAYDMSLTAEAEASMRGWLDNYNKDNYQREHGSHSYTAEEYGLKTGAIRERFTDYIEQYLR